MRREGPPAWMQVVERRLEQAAEVVEPRLKQAAEESSGFKSSRRGLTAPSSHTTVQAFVAYGGSGQTDH